MMVADILSFLNKDRDTLPVSIVDALEAGVAALALDEARRQAQLVDLTETWAAFDQLGLRGQG